ncbi:MAG: triose-phosphate isomerase [Parcubacteria group bacterium]
MEKLVVGNMKMNILSPLEREQYFNSFKKELAGKKMTRAGIILCPPVVHLEAFKKLKNKKVSLGVQNIFWERNGSYTGEISPDMAKNFGADWVILGHSERRRYFGENDEEIGLKIMAALKIGIRPILCVGENDKRGNSVAVIMGQLKNCLKEVGAARIENVVICYEPVWAISANKPDHLPTTDEVMGARILIKKFLVQKYGAKLADKVKIIYGGSVDSKNVKSICVDSGMDGALVGRESLAPYEFMKIAEIINK